MGILRLLQSKCGQVSDHLEFRDQREMVGRVAGYHRGGAIEPVATHPRAGFCRSQFPHSTILEHPERRVTGQLGGILQL